MPVPLVAADLLLIILAATLLVTARLQKLDQSPNAAMCQEGHSRDQRQDNSTVPLEAERQPMRHTLMRRELHKQPASHRPRNRAAATRVGNVAATCRLARWNRVSPEEEIKKESAGPWIVSMREFSAMGDGGQVTHEDTDYRLMDTSTSSTPLKVRSSSNQRVSSGVLD